MKYSSCVLGTLTASLLLGAAVLAAAAEPNAAPRLVIKNARIFDGRNLRPERRLTLRITDGKIVEVQADESATSVGETESVTVIDAGGRLVLPGFIDAHVHPSIPLGFTALREADPNYAANRAAVEARAMLQRGFTTIRDMGDRALVSSRQSTRD